MKVIDVLVQDIKRYPNNPRNNGEAVEYVKKSIAEFGFKVPIVIDAQNVIVCGHTRYSAAKELKMKTVPCVVADDLTNEQIKAYRLADNRVAEMSHWDMNALNLELESIAMDMADFGFNLPDLSTALDAFPPVANDPAEQDPDDDGYFGDARERTAERYNLYEFDSSRSDGKFQMPTLQPEQHIPNSLIGFNYLLTSKEYQKGVHFYLDDYQFERLWNSPQDYVDKLGKFDCVLTPDFSLYLNMPMAMKIWNIYRSRLIGQIMQDAGITVIPTLSWAEPETFQFCFDGLVPGGVVSVSTIGVKRDQEATEIWKAGMAEAIKRLRPSAVVVYGGDIGFDFGAVKTVYIANEVIGRWKDRRE